MNKTFNDFLDEVAKTRGCQTYQLALDYYVQDEVKYIMTEAANLFADYCVEKAGEWVSVKERQPDASDPVLIWYHGLMSGNSAVAYYEYGEWFLFHAESGDEPIKAPSFWQPLPKAPKP
jgi:hypothetical protein